MEVRFTRIAWSDFEHWLDVDPAVADRIRQLIKAVQADPFKGLGKPEPLRHELQGYWSRRINHEHRLVYRVKGNKGEDQRIEIIQCRYHYSKDA